MRRLFAVLAALAAPAALAQPWQLVWADEFDVPGAPDAARWTYDLGGHGWGNQELQRYTDRRENARVEGGVLVIEARRESLGGNAYTSARLVTRGLAQWTYGRFEARIRLPRGQGIWPAFWMLPTASPYGGWPASGEIDVMEFLGHQTDRVYGTLHYGGGTLGHRYTGTSYVLPSGTFDAGFHTFGVEWAPREIRWTVDGAVVQRQTGWVSSAAPYPAPFDRPFHLLLNLAVGGQWPGYPDATTVFPQRMEVDYVRVYQSAPTASDDAPEADALALRVAPNPARTVARVSVRLPEAGRLAVYDVLGRRVAEQAVRGPGETTETLDVSGLPAGVYAVVLTAGGASQTVRLTVRR